jgi:hypothetical protein
MKKLVLFAVMTVAVMSAMGANAEFFASQKNLMDVVAVNNDGDVDLYLDCFENAVKSKDMELAAKIANILYGMDMNAAQQKRFSAIENKISKKDYRVYRDNLRYFASKSSPAQDDYYDFYVEPYADDNTYDDDQSFADEIVDAFSSFFNDLGVTDADSASSWHYERHDTIAGGGMYDVFVDAFSNFLYGDDNANMNTKSAADESEMDELLDQYENYVNLAVEALRNVMRGDEAAMNDFEKYSQEASAISDKLTKGGGNMTSKQFKRYMHIWGDMVNGLF